MTIALQNILISCPINHDWDDDEEKEVERVGVTFGIKRARLDTGKMAPNSTATPHAPRTKLTVMCKIALGFKVCVHYKIYDTYICVPLIRCVCTWCGFGSSGEWADPQGLGPPPCSGDPGGAQNNKKELCV